MASKDLSNLIEVRKAAEGDFMTQAYSKVSLPAGAVFAKMSSNTTGTKRYSSVQVGENEHIELNSDLVYCNHSCDPSIIFDTAKSEVRVSDKRALQVGDALTFWYPSSEWEMDQPFDCTCPQCCKSEKPNRISGAKTTDVNELKRQYINPHIRKLLKAHRGIEL